MRPRRSFALPAIVFVVLVAMSVIGCAPASPSTPGTSLATPTVGPVSPAPPSSDPSPSPAPSIRGSPSLRITVSVLWLPAARSRSVALNLGSGILVCGGILASGSTTGSIELIDLSDGRVKTVGVLASPVHDAGGAALAGTGFVFGGGRFGPGTTVQRIDQAGGSTTVGTLPAARADLAAVAVGGELIVVGGGTPARSDVRVLATTNGRTFRVVARLLVAVRYPAVATLDGLVYVIGGATPTGDTSVIQVVDPATGSVRLVGHLGRPLSHATAIVESGTILIAGGRVGGIAQRTVWRLDAPAGGVTVAGRLPYAVSDAAGVVIGGVAYLIGGEGVAPLASIISIATR